MKEAGPYFIFESATLQKKQLTIIARITHSYLLFVNSSYTVISLLCTKICFKLLQSSK